MSIDPAAVDLAMEVRRRTGGRGVDAVLDCAGAAATFSVAPDVLPPRGRYVILAFVPIEVLFAPWLLARGEFELTGSLAYGTGVFSRVIDLHRRRRLPDKGVGRAHRDRPGRASLQRTARRPADEAARRHTGRLAARTRPGVGGQGQDMTADRDQTVMPKILLALPRTMASISGSGTPANCLSIHSSENGNEPSKWG